MTREADGYDDVEEVHLDKDQMAVFDKVKQYVRENVRVLSR